MSIPFANHIGSAESLHSLHKKRLLINMVSQVTSFSINFGIAFFLTPFIVKFIGSEAYGFVGLANNFIGYAQIITIALNSMAGRYITVSLQRENITDTNKYFTSVIIANAVMGLLLVAPITTLLVFINRLLTIPKGLIIDVRLLFALVFANLLLSMMDSVFGVSTFASNRLDLNSVRDTISRLIRLTLLIGAYMLFKPSVWYIGLAAMVSTFFVLSLDVYYTRRLLPEVKIKLRYFDVGKVYELLSSGIWNSLTQLASIISTGLDLLVANLFIGATAMGSLSIAKTVPVMILSLFGVMANVFAPQLTISYAQSNLRDMRMQVLSSTKILGFFSGFPMAILFAFGDVFYKLWVPSQNSELLQILSVLACAEFALVLPLEGLWNVFTVMNKVKQTSLFLLSNSVLMIAIELILLSDVGSPTMKLYVIAGTSTIFSIVRALTFLPLYGSHCLDLRLNAFYPAIIKNSVSVAITTSFSLIVRYVFSIDTWLTLDCAALATTLFSFGLNSILLLGRRERSLIWKRILVKGDNT